MPHLLTAATGGMARCSLSCRKLRSAQQHEQALALHMKVTTAMATGHLSSLARRDCTGLTDCCPGYAFNTFGEVVACWFQDIVLAFLIVKYK